LALDGGTSQLLGPAILFIVKAPQYQQNRKVNGLTAGLDMVVANRKVPALTVSQIPIIQLYPVTLLNELFWLFLVMCWINLRKAQWSNF